MKIGIVDYKDCNILSIYSSIINLGEKVDILTSYKDLKKYDMLVLPGVGAAKNAMTYLKKEGFYESILEFNQKQKKILGIFLGKQIFGKKLYENGETDGFGFFNANVIELGKKNSNLKTHIGWKKIIIEKEDSYINLKNNLSFYFCHSYYMDFIDRNDPCIIGNIELKEKIPVIIKNKNIIGVQFHPEKSQTNGINFFKDFIDKKLYDF